MLLVAAIGLTAAAIFALFFFWIFPALGFDGTARFAHSIFQVLFPIYVAGAVVLGVIALALRYSLVGKVTVGALGLSILGGVLSGIGIGSDVGIGNIWSAFNRADHERRIEFVAELNEVEEARPSYDERIALDQAEFQIRRSLAGVVGDFSSPTRVGEEWCSYCLLYTSDAADE